MMQIAARFGCGAAMAAGIAAHRHGICSRVCASPAVPAAWESFCRMYTNEMKDAVDMLSRILYEDKDIIVAYKPAGLAVQTARLGQQDMVSGLLKGRQ